MKPSNRKSFLVAIGFTLASGWIGVGVNRLLGERNSMESPGTLIWLVTPLASTVADRLIRRNSAPSGWSLALPRALPWYAVGAVMFPAVTSISLRFGKAMNWVDTSGVNKGALASKAVSSFGPNVAKNVFEEAVWRGYVTNELQQHRINDGQLNVTVGLVWGLWHLPYYLFFLPEEEIRQVLDVSRPKFAAIAVGTMVAWTVPYTELYRLSGSIWPCVLMHAAEDAFVNPLLIDNHVEFNRDRKRFVSPIVGIIPSALYVAVGLAMRQVRLTTRLGRA